MRMSHKPFTHAVLLVSLLAISHLATAQAQALPSDTQIEARADDESEESTLTELLGSYLACQLGAVYLQDLARSPLYSRDASNACVQSSSLDDVLFSDDGCSTSVAVRQQSMSEYCLITSDKSRLGDGSALDSQISEWTLTPGPRLAVTLPRFDDDTLQPYQGSVSFQQSSSERGTCSLEMRIYTPNPGAKNLRPVLAFHGGSWSQRGAGFMGLESLMAHFSSRDMVVFAPFYRLAGDQDGPSACRQFIAEDIVADAVAALAWVKQNGTRYGARDGKIGVFGQSAGGFLANWVAVNYAADIDAALLMYPPTDVGAFIDDLDSGVYSNERGVGILERFLGTEQAQWSDDPARIAALSMAQQIDDGAASPPIRMIHGLADDLVLPNQSERLCDALSGAVLADTVDSGRLQRRACGEGGQLDLIEGAEHALEVCALGADCKAGDLLSAAAAEKSLREGYDWLASFDATDAEDSAGEGSDDDASGDDSAGDDGAGDGNGVDVQPADNAGGGGASVLLTLLAGLALWRRNRKA